MLQDKILEFCKTGRTANEIAAEFSIAKKERRLHVVMRILLDNGRLYINNQWYVTKGY